MPVQSLLHGNSNRRRGQANMAFAPCYQTLFWLFALLIVTLPLAHASVTSIDLDATAARSDDAALIPQYHDPDVRRNMDQLSAYERFRHGVMAYYAFDQDLAAELLLPLAQTGHASAQYYVALMYDQGVGVEQDSGIAIRWYKRSAEAGHIDAQYNLGVAYARGNGVQRDLAQAAQWWQRSARQGNVDAQYNLGLLYFQGKGVDKNIRAAARWWQQAAARGDAQAQYKLGMVYVMGEGIEPNVCEATRLWQLSSAQGFGQAMHAIELLKDVPTGCLEVSSHQ